MSPGSIGPAVWVTVGGLSLLVAALGTWAARRYALSRAMLDQPGARRSHLRPTPRGGGLGIVFGVIAATPAILWLVPPTQPRPWLVLVAGTLAVAAVGWWDDRHGLSARVRLLVQGIAAVAMATALYGEPTTPAVPLLWVAAVVWLVGMANVWNFMDGIDGIAATQTVVVALGLWLLPGALDGAWALLALAIAAASLGFLPFNFPRARVFMGDVGSGACGFLLGGLLLVAAAGTGSGRWPALLLLPSLFLVDAGMTLAARMIRRRRWWRAHREHVYQWAVRSGHSHRDVTLTYMICAVFGAIMAAVLWRAPPLQAWAGLILAWTGLLLLGMKLKLRWVEMRRRRRKV